MAQQPTIQFDTRAYPGTRGQQLRTVWSTDGGQTWHEPEEATIEVARAWQALCARQAQRQGR